MAEGDRRAAKKEQDAAFSRVMAVVLDPKTQSLRGIALSDYDLLTPERQGIANALMAANLRGDGPAANPEYYRALAGNAEQGALTVDDMRPVDTMPTANSSGIEGEESGDAALPGGIVVTGTRNAVYRPGIDGISFQNISARSRLSSSKTPSIPYLSSLHDEILDLASKYPADPGTNEWTVDDLLDWKIGGGNIFDFKSQWVHGYRDAINAAAGRFDLPPELVAGVAFNEVGASPCLLMIWRTA